MLLQAGSLSILILEFRFDFKDIAQRGDSGDGKDLRRLLRELAADRQHAKQKDITDENVPDELRSTWELAKEQVLSGKLPLLSCLEPHPVKLRFAHLSLQEFLCVEKWLAEVDRD